jgi:hypothetical protein
VNRVIRIVAAATLAAVCCAATAVAEPDPGRYVRMLEGEGFGGVTVRRTLLGRILITGSSGDRSREIVLDRHNGAVLSDFTSGEAEAASARASGDGPAKGPAGGDAPVSTAADAGVVGGGVVGVSAGDGLGGVSPGRGGHAPATGE